MRAEPWMNDVPESSRAKWRAQVAERPRILFRAGRDWVRGPDWFELGFLWDRDFDATPGQSCYRRAIVLRWRINLRLEWNVRRSRN